MSATATIIAVTKQDENAAPPTSKYGIQEGKRFSADARRISNVELSSSNNNRTVKLGTTTATEGAYAISSENQSPVSSGRQSPHAENQEFDAITPQMRKNERVAIAAMCFSLFLAGWNDGTTGPLLPRIQEVYGVCRDIRIAGECLTPFIQVGYAVVSVIFICSCVGFIAGSLANVYMTDRYNFGLVCNSPFVLL
jgi:hypothetical protein